MAYLEEDGRQQARASRVSGTTPPAPEAAPPARSLGPRLWFAALVVVLILVLLAAGLTALGYGPLASRFKSLRSFDAPAPTGTVGGAA